MDSIVYGFDSDEEIKDNILDPDSLNPHDYEIQKIINFFHDNKLNDEQSKEYLIKNLIID